jgi:hypothetical protein
MTSTLRAALLLAGLPAALSAQLPISSTRAVGMGGGYTAAARGFEAIAWNPALLGMPGRPGASFNFTQLSLAFGSNSLGLSDFRKYQDAVLTQADKDTIMDLIRQGDPARPLAVDLGMGFTALALQLGGLAASLSGAGAVEGALGSDAIELLLYGNVTRPGPGQTYTGAGTSAEAWAGGTFALSYGAALPVPVGALAVGATFKYTRGIGVARVEDLGTSLQTNPTFVAKAGVHGLVTDLDSSTANGSAIGLDVGGAYELASGIRFGVVIENLLNETSWKDDHLAYYRKEYRITQNGDQYTDSTVADIDRVPYDESDPLQRALRDSLRHGTYPTRIRAGVYLPLGPLHLAGGITLRAREGLTREAASHAAVGAELRIIPFLPLRAGIATDLASGTTLSGGFGLKLGPVRIDTALSNTPSGDHQGFLAAVGISIMN